MSIQLFVADKVVRFTMKRRFRRNPSAMELRAIMAELPIRSAPKRIRVENVVLGGIAAERLATAQSDEDFARFFISMVAASWRACLPITARLPGAWPTAWASLFTPSTIA